MDRLISQTFKIDGVLTDCTTTPVLSDPTDTYGIKRDDKDPSDPDYVVEDNDTAMTRATTGTYEHTFTALVNVAYTAYIEMSYGGDTFYVEYDIPAVSDDYGMLASYSSLLERVGHFLFGIRSGFSADQTTDIEECIRDGLRRVYASHNWSFLKPVTTITTVDGTATYSLPATYYSIESEMFYAPGESDAYPPILQRHDAEIRRRQQDDDEENRPLYFSVREVEFDPEVGSLKQLVLYPTPDDEYVLYANMTLRPTMITSTDQYPVGAEQLSQLIVEACLAAAENDYDENEAVHSKRYVELLPLSIAADQLTSSPMSLGNDAPRGETGDSTAQSVLIGDITLDGETL